MMMAGSYNMTLVLVSVLVAIMASYTALDMAGRIAAAQGRSAHWWLAGGSFAMGTGIWSMHFIGMLAFSLPVPMGYDVRITFLSLLIAIASSMFALWLVCQKVLSWARIVSGALLMGFGISAMHYTGMASMRMTPGIHYSPSLFILSIVIAVVASGAALWIAFRLRRQSSGVRLLRIGAAVIMGFAITGMHYTGMAAAQIPMDSVCSAVPAGMNTTWLALLIVVATLAVLSIALVISVLDMRLETRTAVFTTSLANANRELMYRALHDDLTKLPNRVLLSDRLDQAIQKAKSENSRFYLMFIDLDGFKAVNDSFGHHIGDSLLVAVANRVRSIPRAQDTLARVGGDEFVLLTDLAEPMDATSLADTLVTAIGQPFEIEGRDVCVSASIGVASYNGQNESQDTLLMNADAAMYEAKAQGRNCYCFFDASMNANAHEHLSLLHDLRSALQRHELVLYYQPQFDALNQDLVGAEALLRWQHPTRGLIPPDKFIPLAEKSGLIVPIGEWVLEEACRQMSEWQHSGHKNWTIAVNLSPLQFGHSGLAQMVRATLARHRLEPCSLTLEVTESTAMRDPDTTMVILQELCDMGVKIAIDDFGTGYSSLLYLKRLPASQLKVDRGFVRDLAHDTEDAAIISAIVALGHTLNLKVVAEGVETAKQQAFLTRLGCNTLQGFLLGRPMPADLFLETALPSSSLLVSSEPRLGHQPSGTAKQVDIRWRQNPELIG